MRFSVLASTAIVLLLASTPSSAIPVIVEIKGKIGSYYDYSQGAHNYAKRDTTFTARWVYDADIVPEVHYPLPNAGYEKSASQQSGCNNYWDGRCNHTPLPVAPTLMFTEGQITADKVVYDIDRKNYSYQSATRSESAGRERLVFVYNSQSGSHDTSDYGYKNSYAIKNFDMDLTSSGLDLFASSSLDTPIDYTVKGTDTGRFRFTNRYHTDVCNWLGEACTKSYISFFEINGFVESVKVSRVTQGSAEIPEPKSFALMALGLVAFLATRRKARRN